MKKFLLIALLVFAGFSCKKEKEEEIIPRIIDTPIRPNEFRELFADWTTNYNDLAKYAYDNKRKYRALIEDGSIRLVTDNNLAWTFLFNKQELIQISMNEPFGIQLVHGITAEQYFETATKIDKKGESEIFVFYKHTFVRIQQERDPAYSVLRIKYADYYPNTKANRAKFGY